MGWRRKIWWITDFFLEASLTLKDTWNRDILQKMVRHIESDPITSERQIRAFTDGSLIDLRNLLTRHFCPDVWFDLACLFEGEKNRFSPQLLEDRFEEICEWQVVIDEDLVEAFFKTKHPVSRLSWEDVRCIISSMKRRRKDGYLGEIDLQTKETVENLQKPNQFAKMMNLKPIFRKELKLEGPKEASHDFTLDESVYSEIYAFLDKVEYALKYLGVSSKKSENLGERATRETIDRRILIDLGDHHWTTPRMCDMYGESTSSAFLSPHFSLSLVTS
jgi:hypothetical protein